jgi:hypothetical protein
MSNELAALDKEVASQDTWYVSCSEFNREIGRDV